MKKKGGSELQKRSKDKLKRRVQVRSTYKTTLHAFFLRESESWWENSDEEKSAISSCYHASSFSMWHELHASCMGPYPCIHLVPHNDLSLQVPNFLILYTVYISHLHKLSKLQKAKHDFSMEVKNSE